MDHGRFFVFSPVFLGAGAALWFELASDRPTIRLGAWFVALALIFDQWRRALAAELDQLPSTEAYRP
jgi:hypothetical protein